MKSTMRFAAAGLFVSVSARRALEICILQDFDSACVTTIARKVRPQCFCFRACFGQVRVQTHGQHTMYCSISFDTAALLLL